MQNDPATRVSAPAIGLMVTGGLGVVLGLGEMVVFAVFGVAALTDKNTASNLPGVGVLIGAGLLGVVLSAFVIYAGWQMRQLKGWTLSLAGAILAMIPCLSPCCFLGLPMGIWAILVLIDEDVKRAFATGGFGPPPGGFGPPPGPPSGGFGPPSGSTPGGYSPPSGGFTPPPPPPGPPTSPPPPPPAPRSEPAPRDYEPPTPPRPFPPAPSGPPPRPSGDYSLPTSGTPLSGPGSSPPGLPTPSSLPDPTPLPPGPPPPPPSAPSSDQGPSQRPPDDDVRRLPG